MKIGIIRGRFELIHPGHIKLFKEAKNIVDELIVMIDSSKYINERNEKKSLNSDEYRRLCLEGIKNVNSVHIFYNENDFISKCQSQMGYRNREDTFFYFKGGDYLPSDLNEAARLRRLGFQIVCLDYDSEYSTTKTIDNILEVHGAKPKQLELEL